MTFSTFFAFFLNGLTSAMTFFIIASGLTLIYGVLRILNLAHGSLFMLGAFFTFQLTHWFGNFWYALILAPFMCAVAGVIIERIFIRPVYGLPIPFQLLLTFGLMLLIADIVRIFWGVAFRTATEPKVLSGTMNIFGVSYPRYNVFVIIVGILVGIFIWILLTKTRFGKMIRASSSDREVANGLGINVPWLYTAVFGIGAYLAGLSGVLAAPLRSIMLEMDVHTIIEAFAIVVIGGLGSIPGALIGSLLLGQLNSFGTLYIPRFEMAFMYVFMAIILLIRPKGLLGEEVG
jgi:branched-chain amino acid transport system permease protein